MSMESQSIPMDRFIFNCVLGELDIVKEMIESNPDIVKNIQNVDKFYVHLLKNNLEDIALCLVSVRPEIFDIIFDDNTSKFINKFLMMICKKNYIRTAKLIMYEHTVDFRIHERYLLNACLFDSIDMVKYIYTCIDDHYTELSETAGICKSALSPFELSEDVYKDLFKSCCSRGSIKVVKWIFNTCPNFKENVPTMEMLLACGEDSVEMAKWIYEQRPENEIIDFKYLVYTYCIDEEIKLAEWALEMSKDVTNEWKNTLFFDVCLDGGEIDTAKWLLEKMPEIDISAERNMLFKYACNLGKEELVRWLLSINIKILEDDEMDSIFEATCIEGRLNIADLVASNSIRYNITIGHHSFYEYISDWYIKKPLEQLGVSFDINEDECCVCLETSNLVTECNHHICADCIYKVKSCPCCRSEMSGYYIC